MTKYFILFFFSATAFSAELLTNCARFSDVPKWVNLSRVNRIADSVTRIMEWDIRRVEVQWYQNQKEFESVHSLGPMALAVTQRGQNRILLGPKVIDSNFDRVFGHELVHITSAQKYKDAIPKWLEEGMANHIANFGKVDYKTMLKRPLPKDVTKMIHPMSGNDQDILNHYMTSQALAEMLSARCDFRNLLRLSVQRKMEDYLEKVCRISDINQTFQKWVSDQALTQNKAKK
ncbi:MAG: hypothetical protein B7Y39_02315 [Bdellovibrio sp. 28-41-41]|nr:MAG: hypothetical protein B7Y39_02315 [Bdellovibrio sp. 28-41-41]